ncbi:MULTISPECIES: 3-deoxy-manno-octulosonate cytidylyltransferase [Burkholderia]|uniref:3-deoxy-manno-octulosonate cytidylyltransferase n=1 Tax=Burkholderia TaxID=32008 RepID=UPI0011990D38|nr:MULTISPECIES: 3-deoxy-manno-octulosonate cytidylyltransferase [Burkholderia]MDN7737263.1 3-deoxy-manno-octulosonate cytidylyltransferase [Burkholderia gladioli]TWC64710.1 3-deoxy-manno-octulosonate cytidylyltransferase (CMP-KDO synthetase) [Burkholderia sp. SJZ089]TWC97556.1 3-deoxy-manno-octulosonate cytidylyltransferase (CMP-KDO synthetase) [Burkholderia sp. SJZ115]TWD00672.1 3-deoxy-manno-octulosonate cytidylyltransferase (CMP-KDO synthetase) [Burkholderia sp. SJZ091]
MPSFNSGRTARVVIPARYGSTRLPGKPLVDLNGEPMIVRVHARVRQALPDADIVVAIDDARVADVLAARGIRFAMTDPGHASGTDRAAEVAREFGWLDSGVLLNVQGDEPLVPIALLKAFSDFCLAAPELGVATVACPIGDIALLDEPSIVKLVVDQLGRALYFSRAAIPFCRDGRPTQAAGPEGGALIRHVGLYAYSNAALQTLASAAPCELEQLEKLEQLRALWLGMRIDVMRWPDAPPAGVDTSDDVARVVSLLKRQVHDETEPS